MIEWLVQTHRLIVTWLLWVSVAVSAATGATMASWIEFATRSYDSGPGRHGTFVFFGLVAGGAWGFLFLAAFIGHMLTLTQVVTVLERIERSARALGGAAPALPERPNQGRPGPALDRRASPAVGKEPAMSWPGTGGSGTRPDGRLRVGDRVTHTRWGEGEVTETTKIEDGYVFVMFSGRPAPILMNLAYLRVKS